MQHPLVTWWPPWAAYGASAKHAPTVFLTLFDNGLRYWSTCETITNHMAWRFSHPQWCVPFPSTFVTSEVAPCIPHALLMGPFSLFPVVLHASLFVLRASPCTRQPISSLIFQKFPILTYLCWSDRFARPLSCHLLHISNPFRPRLLLLPLAVMRCATSVLPALHSDLLSNHHHNQHLTWG